MVIQDKDALIGQSWNTLIDHSLHVTLWLYATESDKIGLLKYMCLLITVNSEKSPWMPAALIKTLVASTDTDKCKVLEINAWALVLLVLCSKSACSTAWCWGETSQLQNIVTLMHALRKKHKLPQWILLCQWCAYVMECSRLSSYDYVTSLCSCLVAKLSHWRWTLTGIWYAC